MTIMNRLGVYGWSERDENVLMAALLTGDPLLLIGKHGCAKTHAVNKVAMAIGRRFCSYDASKAMFDDVLGYPDIEKLKRGEIAYVASKITIFDKEIVLIDELNRCDESMQSKWLEIIRSRKIMGFPTDVKWVMAAMNPISYAGTRKMDAALIGRFASFLFVKDVHDMCEDDRISVSETINGDDCPGIGEWTPEVDRSIKTVHHDLVREAGRDISSLLAKAAVHFINLKKNMSTLSMFLAKYSELVRRETKSEIELDGRRLGFIFRNILSFRAVELAKLELFSSDNGGYELPGFSETAKHVLRVSIPVGLNDETVNKDNLYHQMEVCFDLLKGYFDDGSDIGKVDTIFELFTTADLIRKAHILIEEQLGDLVESKAWDDMLSGEQDITLLAYVALQVEARRPGTIPKEILTALGQAVNPERMSTGSLRALEGRNVDHYDEVVALLERDTDLERAVAYSRVAGMLDTYGGNLSAGRIERVKHEIDSQLEELTALIG